MNRLTRILPAALLTLVLPAVSQTQQPESKPFTHTYRLTYTLTVADAGKRVGVQHFALTVSANANHGTVKMGEKVPVATGSFNSGTDSKNGVQTQFTYLDVGINIEATLAEDPNGLQLTSKVEQSSVAPVPVKLDNVNEPIIRQMVLNNTSVIAPGKSVTLGSMDIPDSTRHVDIDVAIEQLP